MVNWIVQPFDWLKTYSCLLFILQLQEGFGLFKVVRAWNLCLERWGLNLTVFRSVIANPWLWEFLLVWKLRELLTWWRLKHLRAFIFELDIRSLQCLIRVKFCFNWCFITLWFLLWLALYFNFPHFFFDHLKLLLLRLIVILVIYL